MVFQSKIPLFLIVFILNVNYNTIFLMRTAYEAPKAQKIETVLKDKRVDPYYWMNQKSKALPYIKER